MADDAPGTIRLADYAPAPFAIDTVDLDVTLDPEVTLVRNRMRIRRQDPAAPAAPLRLDGARLSLLKVSIDGEALSANRYVADDEGLTLHDAPDDFTLEIETETHPRQNRGRTGLMEIGGKLVTQCEPEGFRRLTYFTDRPDVLSTYEVTLRADGARYPVLLSNGNLVGEGVDEAGRRVVRWSDPYP